MLNHILEDCEYCSRIQPAFEEALLLLNTDPDYNHQVGIIDCDLPENSELLKKFKIERYPTVFIMSPANDYQGVVYRGEGSGEAYASALKIHTGYAPIRLSSLDSLLERANVLMESFVLGIFENQEDLYKQFIKASENLRFIRFYYLILDKSNSTEHEKKENTIYIVHNPFFTDKTDSEMIPFIQEEWNNTLDSFILRHLTHTIEICTQQTIKIYKILHKNYITLFMDLYEDLNTTKEIGREISHLLVSQNSHLKACISGIDQDEITKKLLEIEEGDMIIFELNGTMVNGKGMLKKTEEKIKYKLDTDKMKNWMKDYNEGKLISISMEKKAKEIKDEIRRNITETEREKERIKEEKEKQIANKTEEETEDRKIDL